MSLNVPACSRVTLKSLHFLGTTVSLKGPTEGTKVSTTLAISGCRFLYNPLAIELETTKRRGRGAADPVLILSNVIEFGEKAVSYVASGARIEHNMLVGNGYAVSLPLSLSLSTSLRIPSRTLNDQGIAERIGQIMR